MKYKLRLFGSDIFSSLYKKENLFPILIYILLSKCINVHSHEVNNLHDTCLSALDYPGCIRSYKAKIQIPSESIWRRYGSIKVNWSNWRSKGQNHIVPALNKNENPIYIAVNCQKSMINTTGPNASWKEWLPPVKGFERKLLADFCESSFSDEAE